MQGGPLRAVGIVLVLGSDDGRKVWRQAFQVSVVSLRLLGEGVERFGGATFFDLESFRFM